MSINEDVLHIHADEEEDFDFDTLSSSKKPNSRPPLQHESLESNNLETFIHPDQPPIESAPVEIGVIIPEDSKNGHASSNSPGQQQVAELRRGVGELNVNNGEITKSSSDLELMNADRGRENAVSDGDDVAMEEAIDRNDEPMDMEVVRKSSGLLDGQDKNVARIDSNDQDIENVVSEEGALESDGDDQDEGEYEDSIDHDHQPIVESEDSSSDSESTVDKETGANAEPQATVEKRSIDKTAKTNSGERSERSTSKKRKVSHLEREEEHRHHRTTHQEHDRSSTKKAKKSHASTERALKFVRDDPKMDVFFEGARFFLIKSGNSENVALSKHKEVWSTTPRNEEILNKAFRETRNVILVFSVEKSQGFQGFCRMASDSRHDGSPVKWSLPPGMSLRNLGGTFKVLWINRRELPFIQTQGLINTWNERKPVKIGRDGTEIEPHVGRQLCGMFPIDDTLDIDSISKKAIRLQEKMDTVHVGDVGDRRRTTRYSETRPVQSRSSSDRKFVTPTAPISPPKPNKPGPPMYHLRNGPPPPARGGMAHGRDYNSGGNRYGGPLADTMMNGTYSDYLRAFNDHGGPPPPPYYGYGHHGPPGGGYYNSYSGQSYNDPYSNTGGYGGPSYGGYAHHQQPYAAPAPAVPHHHYNAGRRGSGTYPQPQHHGGHGQRSDMDYGRRSDKYPRQDDYGRDSSRDRQRRRSISPPPDRGTVQVYQSSNPHHHRGAPATIASSYPRGSTSIRSQVVPRSYHKSPPTDSHRRYPNRSKSPPERRYSSRTTKY